MNLKSILSITLACGLSLPAFAVKQSELKLLPKCEAKIEDAIYEKFGKDDETFGIVGKKLLYGGSKGGLHFSAVVLVQASDEVEPRDFLVTTSWVGSEYAEKNGCKIVNIETLADGLTVDMGEE